MASYALDLMRGSFSLVKKGKIELVHVFMVARINEMFESRIET